MTAENPQSHPREVIVHVIKAEDLAGVDRKRQRKNLYLLRKLTEDRTAVVRDLDATYTVSREIKHWGHLRPLITYKVNIYPPHDPHTPVEWYRINRNRVEGEISVEVQSSLGILLLGKTRVKYNRSDHEWDSILDCLAHKLRTASQIREVGR